MLALPMLDALYGSVAGSRFGVAIRPDADSISACFTDNVSLAQWLASWTAAGYNVYHSCALFNGHRRKAQFAIGAGALWLDLDVGEGKAFKTQPEAARAMFRFCADVGLPLPSFMSSGRGVHCYWLLENFLDGNTWTWTAARLKQACVQHGLDADPTRTADIASILRSEGSFNFKDNPPSQVRVLQWGRRVSTAELGVLSTYEPAQRIAISTDGRPLLAAAMNIYSYDPADAGMIADECAQVRLLRDWPETHAAVPEPVWRGILGVLKHCGEGDEIAHEWSFGHSAYSRAGTDNKLHGWHAGPATCAYFGSHNPAGCVGCPHASGITSPIQLGRSSRDHVGRIPPVEKSADFVTTFTPPPENVYTSPQAITIPAGFGAGDKGELLAYRENKNGLHESTVVSRSMLLLDHIARGELRGDKHFYVLKHFTPQDGVVTIELPAKEFWGNQGMASLAGKGAVVEDADLFRLYMRAALHEQQTSRKTGMMYEQCGWKESETAFLVGTTLYRAGSTSAVEGTPEITYRGRMLGPRAGGNIDEWKRCADALFGTGREAQSFALLASFGAPLIRFLSTDEGGAIVSLVSRGSGRGKTTALAGVTSVWGEIRGLQLANADTAVARGLTFGALGNLPVVFDELAARESDVVRDFVEMFTNGRDKMRGTQDGEIKHTLATWQTILITASNTSLVDAIVAEGGSTATTMRVIELPVTLPPDATRKGDSLKEGLHRNWGFAGDAFMRHLLNPNILQWARGSVVHAQQQIISQHSFRPEHRFWARTIACAATAGILAQQLGLIQFPVGPILTWVLEHLRDRADASKYDVAHEETAIDVLVNFINEHVSEMLVCADAWKHSQVQVPRVTPRNQLTVRYNIRPGQLFISERELRSYLVRREFPFQDFVHELTSQGIMTGERRSINLGAGTDLSSGPTRCIEVHTHHPALGNATAELERAMPNYTPTNVVPIR